MSIFDKYSAVVDRIDPIKQIGRVSRVQGLLIESVGPQAFVGELCRIILPDQTVEAEVVGLRGNTVQLMPFTEVAGIEIGRPVVGTGDRLMVPVSDELLGRVLDSRGRALDGRGHIGSALRYPAVCDPPDVLERNTIQEQIVTGVRAIDGLVPVGKGQRLGVFSGSGVGKSTLIGMIARNTNAAVNVIALIGERGREVREFIENDLGEEGLARSVIVVSTSNTPPLARLRGAYVATAIAEYFRDQGQDVMLLFDSVTRFARAQREIGLAIGETPANRGFPPSMFSILPKLLERSGAAPKGSITGFYSILVEGDDMDEPVADTVRGILDGHLILSRRLAERYHFPAVDVLGSVSRLTTRITGRNHQSAAAAVRRNLAVFQENEDLINVGAYARGSNNEIDAAIDRMPRIHQFLRQEVEETSTLEETRRGLFALNDMIVEEEPSAGATSPDATSPDTGATTPSTAVQGAAEQGSAEQEISANA